MKLDSDIHSIDRFAKRRHLIRASAMAASGLAFMPCVAASKTDGEISHSAESIHQEIHLNASRISVYTALTDTKAFDTMTKLIPEMQGMPSTAAATQISRDPGGTFVLFGGRIVGRQIELVPGERIVQAWRPTNWEAGIFSIARFVLLEDGAGTKIKFDHTGFPKGDAESLASGWTVHYWEPLAKSLG